MVDFFKAQGVKYGYKKDQPILCDLSFEIKKGEIVGLLGLNGSGKTTFLKCVLGELKYDGKIELEGCDLSKMSTKALASKLGYIPQTEGLDINISVLDVVLMGFYDRVPLFANPTKEQKKRAMEVLSDVGLTGFEDRDYKTLSGGERQLVLIARTLLRDCPLFVLDEPDSSLDAKNKASILSLLKSEAKKSDRSILIAMHDISSALNFCDRIVLLENGRIGGDISPDKCSIEELITKLERVYGKISVQKIGESFATVIYG
jgi:iron complex transport system ATP-binding protein